jgi:hypothetical protein
MRRRGRVEIGPWGGHSKSGRQHQAFLVTAEGKRLRLRRYDGPSMRDEVLEAMEGKDVVVEGLLRDELFIARVLRVAPAESKPDSGRGPSALGGKARRRS